MQIYSKVPGIQKVFNPRHNQKLGSLEERVAPIFCSFPRGNSQRNETTILSGKSFPDLFTPYQKEVILVKLLKPFINLLLTQGVMSS